jgi:hypothetical protein
LTFAPLPSLNGDHATEVFGQSNFTNNAVNANGAISATSLALPDHVFADKERMYISDKDSDRILILPALP